MSDLQVTNTFTDGDIVSSTNFNTNYADIVTYVNNRNSASATWDTMYCTSTSNVPLTANNSTGTQDIVQMKDNGTTVFSINDGGFVNMPYQDFAYSKYPSSPVDILSVGAPRLLAQFVVQTQTHSSMDSAGKFTVQVGGKYLISATVVAQALVSTNHAFNVYIYKNGSLIAKSIGAIKNAVSQAVRITDIVSLSAADYIQIYVEDGTDSFIVASESNVFTGFYVAKLS